jgi:signal transduction histidine kinase
LAAISDLTTGISHELGQPITNIRYTIQFYQRQFQTDVKKREVFKVFDSILDETRRMGDLVKRLSPLTSTRNVMELFDVMQRIKKRIESENNKLVRFKIPVFLRPEKTINIFGDPIHFDQIINNLLLNAIDSIKDKKSKRPKKIEIEVDERDDYIQISFSDTGFGIKTRNKGKIFDPFFTTKPPGQGEGLGLFIIWNLLKMHGGKIRLDSEYKDGARFLIEVPKESKYKKEKF